MPLEIKELVIRATIDTADPDRSPGKGPAGGSGGGTPSEEERRAVIEACVAEVLDVLAHRAER